MKRILTLALALLMALSLIACGTGNTPETTGAANETTESPVISTEAPIVSTEAPESDVTVLGEGETAFAFSVVDLDGNETVFEIHTDETTVGAALVALELVEGSEGEYGLYVTSVNGITADWDADQTYWAFYIDGEYAMTGVDATDITAGAAYSFVLTKG